MKFVRCYTLIIVGVLTAAFFSLIGCKKEPQYPSDSRQILGTKVTITVYDQGQDKSKLAPLFEESFRMMSDWEKKAVKPGPDNQVAALSKGSGTQSIQIDPQAFQLMMRALKLYDDGGKVYDIRYGPMLDAWGFDTKPRVPSQAELDTLQGLVTNGGMFVAGNSILLAKDGMRFDVRAIVIGYVFDQVANMLIEKGIRTAVISSPACWRTMGDAPDKRGFELKINHPLKADSVWATLWAPVGGIAIMSAAQNSFSQNGKTYHSILDPRTGLPADKLWGTIISANDAVTAQGMAYSVFVHGSLDPVPSLGKSLVNGSVLISGQGKDIKADIKGNLVFSLKESK